MNKINVITVCQPPKLKNPLIQCGIRDKTTAEAWAKKNGFMVVYFMKNREKVYGERLRADVAQVAQGLEQASAELVALAEGSFVHP